MGTVTTLPRGQAFTATDLEAMPDDGRRYELIDGSLIVTPAPSPRHQNAVVRLWALLDRACPPALQVLVAPLDVVLATDAVVQPDVLVAGRVDFRPEGLPRAPLLAVEVLSPSTRHIDLELKKGRYEAAGCPSYWIVDPDRPAVTAWELVGGRYQRRAHATGDEAFTADKPFPVSMRPVDLLH